MIITKKSDYALRICRVLKDGNIHNVTEICNKEKVPRAFAYKILRELEMNEVVKSERGNKGGYYLNISLDDVSLYDVVSLLEDDVAITHCMKEDCERNRLDEPCLVHQELRRVQDIMENELKKKKMSEILDC